MTKLICFDLDGVIVEPHNFWLELHKALGTLEEGTVLTKKYLYTDYQKLVEEVVHKLWKGKNAAPYYALIKKIAYLPGVAEIFKEIKKQDWMTAIISSGSLDLARRVQHDLGIDHIYANELIIKNNIITGEFVWPIGSGNHHKVKIIKHLCQDFGIKPKEVIYVGDSESDIEAFEFVGTSIAFNATSEKLKKKATHIVEGNNLRQILPYIRR